MSLFEPSVRLNIIFGGFLWFLTPLFDVDPSQEVLQEFSRVALKMGSRFEIIVVTADSSLAEKAINAGYVEIDRIEQLISSWIPNSETSQIITQAGLQPVKVSRELFDLIYRSLKVSQLTNGAYDITFSGMGSLWKFEQQTVASLPDSALVREMSALVNFQNVILNQGDTTVYLRHAGMKIGFGSIGKGYAANQAVKIMKNLGVSSGMVNAGGDMLTWGLNKEGKEWTMGIASPDEDRVLAWLTLRNMALVTSGNYVKYFNYRGSRYGHILDPRTGYPVTGIKSVSILCPDVELADALATSVYVLGASKGLDLINKLNGVEGLIITEDDRILQSDNLTLNYYSADN